MYRDIVIREEAIESLPEDDIVLHQVATIETDQGVNAEPLTEEQLAGYVDLGVVPDHR